MTINFGRLFLLQAICFPQNDYNSGYDTDASTQLRTSRNESARHRKSSIRRQPDGKLVPNNLNSETSTLYPQASGTNKGSNVVVKDRVGNPESHCEATYCLEIPNYPKDLIQSLDLEKYQYIFGEDLIDNVALRFDTPEEQGLCQSRRRLIHPKKGQTLQNSWLTIVNDDDKHRQGVIVEECVNIQQPCDYSQNFPLSVKTKCKQQYVYRNLLAINSDGKPVMEHFQFPSCCKCMVTSSYGTRFGDDEHRRDRLILA
ncbi:unnamed protein product [Diamesa hyperborea]